MAQPKGCGGHACKTPTDKGRGKVNVKHGRGTSDKPGGSGGGFVPHHEPHQDYNGSHSNTRFLWDGKAEK